MLVYRAEDNWGWFCLPCGLWNNSDYQARQNIPFHSLRYLDPSPTFFPVMLGTKPRNLYMLFEHSTHWAISSVWNRSFEEKILEASCGHIRWIYLEGLMPVLERLVTALKHTVLFDSGVSSGILKVFCFPKDTLYSWCLSLRPKGGNPKPCCCCN